MSTYINGFRFKLGSISKKTISAVCSHLSKKWGLDVIPEGTSGGGLQIILPDGYKSIRFSFNRWPWIKGGEREDWINDNDFLCSNVSHKTTFLKAFRGALWTRQEVIDVAYAFELYGVHIDHSTIPLEKDLITVL